MRVLTERQLIHIAREALSDYLLEHQEWLPHEEQLWYVLGTIIETDLRLRGADPDKARAGACVALTVLRERRDLK